MNEILITRHNDWRKRLAAYLAVSFTKDFDPGKFDCALDCAAAVQAMTGHDFARGHRGYRTLSEGQKRLESKGYSDHVAYARSILPRVATSFARVGDLAVIRTDDGPALGVVIGDKISVIGPSGRGTVPLNKASFALKVGQ